MSELLPLRKGVYPPLPTFFDVNEELDLQTYQRHIRNLAQTEIAGYVVMGSNGEATHLSQDERVQVVEASRAAAGPDALLLVGCGEQSTRATIHNCRRAAQAGGDYALVISPFYFKGRMDERALLAHYRAVADASPLPVLLYNMPANTAGLDLDVALVCALAAHPNIVGLKDSAGNIAKLAQIVDQVPAHFAVFAGSAGYLLPALAVGALGSVAALANIFPQKVCQIQTLFESGHLADARLLQGRLVAANTAITTTYGVSGLKAALEITAGYGGRPRSPLLALTAPEHQRLVEILGVVTDL